MRRNRALGAIGSMLLLVQLLSGCQSTRPLEKDILRVGDSGIGITLGVHDAPVLVIEFSDYECLGCAISAEKIFPIVSSYVAQNQVRYVFKDFPLPQHANSRVASQAAHCAYEQDRWNDMHDLLFRNQAVWSLADNPSELMYTYAIELGLDTERFSECLADERVSERIQASVDEAFDLELKGTPTIFVDGKMVPPHPQEVAKAIEAALQGKR